MGVGAAVIRFSAQMPWNKIFSPTKSDLNQNQMSKSVFFYKKISQKVGMSCQAVFFTKLISYSYFGQKK